ncbi:MAG: NrdH-redoxin [Hadesarchaea archaeon]|nr:MAG: NrdH-redoxin [Hadesarchaea archaeon]TEU14684.1 MAG: NrdH-redoxin [Hadesarchaea archaeon]
MRVKIYTTPVCPYCRMAKEFLTQRGVEFEEVNVQENRGAALEMIQKTGQNGVPVIEINNKIIVGFNQEKIIEALGL